MTMGTNMRYGSTDQEKSVKTIVEKNKDVDEVYLTPDGSGVGTWSIEETTRGLMRWQQL